MYSSQKNREKNASEILSRVMTSSRQRVDGHMKGGAELLIVTKFMLVNLISTKQGTVLMLSFEQSGLKSLD